MEKGVEWQVGRILIPPPERRIHPADRRAVLGLPDVSGVPIGIAVQWGTRSWMSVQAVFLDPRLGNCPEAQQPVVELPQGPATADYQALS